MFINWRSCHDYIFTSMDTQDLTFCSDETLNLSVDDQELVTMKM